MISRSTPAFATAALLAAAMAPHAVAAPQNATVKRGNVTIEQIGNEFRVTASDGSIVEYSAFDIANGEVARFLSQSGKSGDRILNRVTTLNRAEIDGFLTGNMKVYLAAPGGITFGPNADVLLPGFVAVAGNLSDDDFINGVDRFTGLSNSIIIEQGADIDLADTGIFAAQHVFNAGDVVVEDGSLIVAVGNEVMITNLNDHVVVKVTGSGVGTTANTSLNPAIHNTGEFAADNGQIIMAAGDPLGAADAAATSAFAQAQGNAPSNTIQNNGFIASLGSVDITASQLEGAGLVAADQLTIQTTEGIGNDAPVNLLAGNTTLENTGNGDIDVTFINTEELIDLIENDDDFDDDDDLPDIPFGLGTNTIDRISTLGDVNVTSTGGLEINGLVEGNNVALLSLASTDINSTVQGTGDIEITSTLGDLSLTDGSRVESFGGDITLTAMNLNIAETATVEAEQGATVVYTGIGGIDLGVTPVGDPIFINITTLNPFQALATSDSSAGLFSEGGNLILSDAQIDRFFADTLTIVGVNDAGIRVGAISPDNATNLTLITNGGISEESVNTDLNISNVNRLSITAGGNIGNKPATRSRADIDELIDIDVESLDVFVTRPGTVNINDTAGNLVVERIFTTSGDIRIEAVDNLALRRVTANSEIVARSANGSIGLGNLSASEAITLTANNSITDARTGSANRSPNLSAGTNINLTANSIGTRTDPIVWNGNRAKVTSGGTSGFVADVDGNVTVTPAGVTTIIRPTDAGIPPIESQAISDIASDIPRDGDDNRGDAADGSNPLWVITDFQETLGWLAPHEAVANADREWGAELASLIEVTLQERGRRTAGIGDETVSEAEVTELIQQGLEYRLGGEIESLEAYVDEQTGEPMARLTVVYQLEKNIAQQLRVVQKRRLRTTNGSEPVITVPDLEALMDMTAERIVDRVVEDTPAGMMGVRG
ncbi:MAG: filamentous hemagglutinin N-terminal domain-containing protein [Planctomycetota bacterium]